jgi:hypothetical protein
VLIILINSIINGYLLITQNIRFDHLQNLLTIKFDVSWTKNIIKLHVWWIVSQSILNLQEKYKYKKVAKFYRLQLLLEHFSHIMNGYRVIL